MPVSESQKKSSRAWDRENMRSMSCRLRKEKAQMFKDYCADIGSTPSAELKKYISFCLDKYYGKE